MGISYPSITYKYDDVGFITKQQKERVQLSEPQTNQNTYYRGQTVGHWTCL